MKRFYRAEALRAADSLAEERYFLGGGLLMENAGRGAAEAIGRHFPAASNVLVLCGPGNNGGDGFVAARHLAIAGAAPALIAVRSVGAYAGAALMAAKSAQAFGLEILVSETLSDEEIAGMIRGSDLVVDALLGTGSSGLPRGEVERLICLCRGEAIPCVSLDIPSGIDPDTGIVPGAAIKAALTVTFAAEKTGLAVAPGSLLCGKTEVCHIGLPARSVLPDAADLTGYDRSDIVLMTRRVPPDAHKGSKGKLLIVGGSHRYRGAPYLAARGALRAGCGLVTLAVPDFVVSALSSLLPEAVFEPLPHEDGQISHAGFSERIPRWLDEYDAAVVGPGIGRLEPALAITASFWRDWKKPLLIDADSLFHLSRMSGSISMRSDAVITPHEGEAARLLATSPAAVADDRLASCRALARRFCVAVLKGPNTLIADARETRAILEGSPSLAVAGSGDVQSGVTGALLAAGMTAIDAATLGALVHAQVGTDAWRDGRTVMATEIADGICCGGHRDKA